MLYNELGSYHDRKAKGMVICMKKGKTVIIVSVLLVAIIPVSLLFSGCHKGERQDIEVSGGNRELNTATAAGSTAGLEDGARAVASDFLTAYQNRDASAGEYLAITGIGNSVIDFSGFQGMVAEKLTYRITGSEVSGEDEASVNITADITNLDLTAILTPLESSEEDPDQLLLRLYDVILSDDAPVRTYQCTFPVRQYPDRMLIILTPELSNALFGGLNEYLASLNND